MADLQRALARADKAGDREGGRARPACRARTASRWQPTSCWSTTSGGKPGFAAAEEAGYAVAVTTEITPELADEGLARELVRRIQEMRKSAGFEIADRIRLSYDGGADVARVMQRGASTSRRRRWRRRWRSRPAAGRSRRSRTSTVAR